MAKSKAIAKTDEVEEIKPYIISSAIIKEALCNYGYEIKTGPGSGDKIPNRKGSAIVHDDMFTAFKGLTVHLAIIDDAFKYVQEDLQPIDFYDNHEVAGLFSITGFKVTGNDENEGFILIGEKWVKHGSIGLETPKIHKGSNYPFFEELLEAVTLCRDEVEAYMNGKAAPVAEQLALDLPSGSDENDTDFDNPM
ncbi:MAG: hypothetical protein EOP49_08510 [Sphingobacteriales bacterium]|nr:MAG: hypothetical protein EOP49_08510 [Sphingobacteriales bacterium]